MKVPFVSVCIPVYNAGEYLRQCIDSVLAQTYTDFEILIVDDCSTDGSAEIIREYVRANPAIRYYRNDSNLGLVANWNRCIQLAKGEWIKFIFQDDWMEQNCVEVFVEYSARMDCPFLVCHRRFITGERDEKADEYYSRTLPVLPRIAEIDGNTGYVEPRQIASLAVRFMSMNFIGEPTVTFFRKDVALAAGLYSQSLEQICDLEFALRIASVHGLLFVPYHLTSFRVHDDSVTSRNISEKHYRLSNLEPVRLSCMLLFGKEYQRLRENLSAGALFKLKIYFRVRGYEAWLNSMKSESNRSAYLEMTAAFPETKTTMNAGFTVKAILALLRLRRRIVK